MQTHFKSSYQLSYLLFLLLALISNPGCKQSTEPEETLNPGRRDYVWTVDTIPSFNIMFNVWASSLNDIYVNSTGENWHYNGAKWEEIKGIHASALFGFSKTDLWAIGDGYFNHFGGAQWYLYGTYYYPPNHTVFWQSIWGSSPNNVYAVGMTQDTVGNRYIPVIIEFNGKKWSFLPTESAEGPYVFYQIGNISSSDNNLVVAGFGFQNIFYLYYYDRRNFKLLYKGSTQPQIYYMDSNSYIEIDHKIYTIVNKELQLHYDFNCNTDRRWGMWGRSATDFISVADSGIVHYNGTDFKLLYPLDPKKVEVYWAYVLNDAFLILGNDNSIGNILIKGSLIK